MMMRIGGFFSGIGAHHSAADRLGIDYTMIFQCEFDLPTANAYDTLHGETRNLGDITRVHDIGGENQVDVLFWTPPCQDISNAGRLAGNAKDSGTRSSLAFEVPRILRNTGERERPKYLVMEEVPMMVSKKFKANFDELMDELTAIGYQHTWKVLNACDYGVAQNRKRLFVISKLNGKPPEMPKPIPLTKCMRDYLEPEPVDERYYLSQDRLKGLIWSNAKEKEAERGFRFEPTDGNVIAHTISTRGGPQDGQLHLVEYYGRLNRGYECRGRIVRPDSCSATITAHVMKNVDEGLVYVGDGKKG